ncbi:MAG: glycosyltransferase, partial [Muribaculaceae bacterium]
GNPCGICFNPRNKEEVKAAILELINNQNKSKQFAELAQKRVIEQYSIEQVWNNLFSLWGKLC